MKITVIYGTSRTEKSSTYNIAQQFLAELADGDPVTEFHLPKDMPAFCTGCFNCFSDTTTCPHYKYIRPIECTGCFNCFSDTTTCPHYKYIRPIEEAMQNADLIIITAPVYVFHVPGQVKALLDHFGCRWMGHKPNPQMFRKQALFIITAAKAGMRSAAKDIQDSFDWWGVGRTYSFKNAVLAGDWTEVTDKSKAAFAQEVKKTARKIQRQQGAGPRLKVRMLFYLMRFVQKKYRFIESDAAYWEENGWLDGKIPWKDA